MRFFTPIPTYCGDPTAFYHNLLEHVLSHLPPESLDPRTISFVCHPLSAPDFATERRNIARLATIIDFLNAFTDTRCIHQVPYFARLLNDDPRDFDAKFDIFYNGLIRRCHQVLVAPGWEQSSGCRKEVVYAQSIGKPVHLLTLPVAEFEDTELDRFDEANLWRLVLMCSGRETIDPHLREQEPWQRYAQDFPVEGRI